MPNKPTTLNPEVTQNLVSDWLHRVTPRTAARKIAGPTFTDFLIKEGKFENLNFNDMINLYSAVQTYIAEKIIEALAARGITDVNTMWLFTQSSSIADDMVHSITGESGWNREAFEAFENPFMKYKHSVDSKEDPLLVRIFPFNAPDTEPEKEPTLAEMLKALAARAGKELPDDVRKAAEAVDAKRQTNHEDDGENIGKPTLH